MCPRVLRNHGRLISEEDKSEYDVTFEFHVSSDKAPASGQANGQIIWGEVTTADNTPLPEGIYTLQVSSGETLRVENIGLAGWRVVRKFGP
jgi:hypothetical protein